MEEAGKSGREALQAQVHLAEFGALRDEIARRSTNQQTVRLLGITGLATLLTFAVREKCPELLLAAPYLSAFVMLRWVADSVQIVTIGEYIRKRLSGKLSELAGAPVLEWEGWVGERARMMADRRRRQRRAVLLSDLVLHGSSVTLSLGVPLQVLSQLPDFSALKGFLVVAWIGGMALFTLAMLELVRRRGLPRG